MGGPRTSSAKSTLVSMRAGSVTRPATPPSRSRSLQCSRPRFPGGSDRSRGSPPAFVAFAHVYGGAHLPLDVIGGAGLGLLIGTLTRSGVRLGSRQIRFRCSSERKLSQPGTTGSQ